MERSTPELENLVTKFLEHLEKTCPGKKLPSRDVARETLVEVLVKQGRVVPVIGQPMDTIIGK